MTRSRSSLYLLFVLSLVSLACAATHHQHHRTSYDSPAALTVGQPAMDIVDYFFEFLHYMCLYHTYYLISVIIVNFGVYFYFHTVFASIAMDIPLAILTYKFTVRDFVKKWTVRRQHSRQANVIRLIRYIATRITGMQVNFNQLAGFKDEQLMSLLFALSYILKDEPVSSAAVSSKYHSYVTRVYNALKKKSHLVAVGEFVEAQDYKNLCKYFLKEENDYVAMTATIIGMIQLADTPLVTPEYD